MVKNTKGGNKAKGSKKVFITSNLIHASDDQAYAVCVKLLGDCKALIKFLSGDRINLEYKARICGNMRKKVFIKSGDIVLVSLRDFEDNMHDIVHLYNSDHVKQLVKEKLINNINNKEDNEFEFSEENEDFDFDKL